MKMKTMVIICVSAALALGLAGGGYYWWLTHQVPSAMPIIASQAVDDIQSAVDDVNRRLADDLYADASAAQAGEAVDIPDVNPYRNTNPFTDPKTNQFE